MASDYFQESCKDDTNFVMEAFVGQTGLCPADNGIRSLAYEGGKYSSKKLDALIGYSGLPSNRQAVYRVLGSNVNHKSPKNDGMVEFSSCAGGFPESKFGNTYHDRFYATKLNHADAAFRNGDALVSTAKMPVKWFECLL
ncbi:hypothetical protein PHYPSEUDO_006182 [Phytophthora pseudosyringae]|uniref:Uncharacterized protein n=1 Tax=Phytophthora pseudosyringae TaxID=221518 RepID=A0A8T1VJ98_9STRA|nr:hypothetical protein PHYPSEUDO_006182 [Phytophthora pseudosyringae]